MNKDFYAVILAGGSGTRFWPMSRNDQPKQFLKIYGKESLFVQTLARIKGKIPKENIFIVTNRQYKALVRSQSKIFKIPPANILLEPQGKNTAPAVCWAAQRISSLNPNAVMVVLPSDHLILHKETFLKHMDEAVRLAKDDHLVTFGIVPTRPETGYGYLRTKAVKQKGQSVLKVTQFVEKPSLAKAEEFMKDNNYSWNSGMFVWKASIILAAIKTFLPKISEAFKNGHTQAHAQKVWQKFPAISIDYGVLEKADNVMAVKADNIGWSDVGSWEALYTLLPKDARSNVFKGDVLGIECERVFVRGNKKIVAVIGLKDVVVVDTPDALLVCRTSDSQKVRDVITQLKKKRRKEI